MNDPLSAHDAVYRLLAAAWEPQNLPAADSIPWPDVLRIVGTSNLAGLLYVVSEGLRDAMPPDVRQTLEEAHYRVIAANIRSLHQLGQVRAALSSAGAPVMLLKGAALLDTLYSNPALRLLGDIDLVIPPAAFPACRKVLLDLGYIPSEVEARPGTQLVYRSQEQFQPPGPLQTAVELHWHVLDVPYYMHKLPMDWFWEHSETRTIAGQPFLVLNTMANLVYMPAHLALHHRFEQLHSLLDLALLIVNNQGQVDWPNVIAAARSFELVAALRETLDHLAQCWPSLPLTEPRRQLAAVTPSRADARLFRLLTTEASSTPMRIYTTLVSLPGVAARARYLWDNIFPQPAYMKKRYQIHAGWTLPYWYLYRLLAGLVRFARTLPRAWRIDRSRR
jgi:hypothetical protein